MNWWMLGAIELSALLVVSVIVGWYLINEKKEIIKSLKEKNLDLQHQKALAQQKQSRAGAQLDRLNNALAGEAGGFEDLTEDVLTDAFDGVEMELLNIESTSTDQLKIADDLSLSLEQESNGYSLVQDLKKKLVESKSKVEKINVELEMVKREAKNFKEKAIKLHRQVLNMDDSELSKSKMGREALRLRKQIDKLKTNLQNEKDVAKTLVDQNKDLVGKLKLSYTKDELEVHAAEKNAYKKKLDEAMAQIAELEARLEEQPAFDSGHLLEIEKQKLDLENQVVELSEEVSRQKKIYNSDMEKKKREMQQLEDTIIRMDKRRQMSTGKLGSMA